MVTITEIFLIFRNTLEVRQAMVKITNQGMLSNIAPRLYHVSRGGGGGGGGAEMEKRTPRKQNMTKYIKTTTTMKSTILYDHSHVL